MSVLDLILGRPLAMREEEEHKIGVFAGVPTLGLDALGSCAYGPEAALTLLIPLGVAGLRYIGPIAGIILALLAILYFSYRQTITAYPTGGGSYTVAKENLGVWMGLLAAAALLIDYILTVAVGISAGVGALVSALPHLQEHTLGLCLAILVLIVIVNLRGVRESGTVFAVPTYIFVASLGLVVALGVFRAVTNGGHPAPVVRPPALPKAAEAASLWLLMRAFASGCTAMTGVEAVSNGVSAFAQPAQKNAQRTLTAIVIILGALLAGIAYLSHAYHIGATLPDHPGYQSVISQIVAAVAGRGVLYYVTIGSVLSVLSLSANTGFADFPRLCRLLAKDDYLPRSLADRGRRLVYSIGIIVLAVLTGGLLVVFGGITDRLIPLFAVGAFMAFTLSQAGMVMHWKRVGGPHSGASLVMNAVGELATGIALAVVIVAKFREGACITILMIPAILYLFHRVHLHYDQVKAEIGKPVQLKLEGLHPPIVIVPVTEWNRMTEKALRLAIQLSPEVIGLHFATGEEDTGKLEKLWADCVEEPAREAGILPPRLSVITSPYRRVVDPTVRFVHHLRDSRPDRRIAVIIPELVEARWYQYMLHHQRATRLKAALLFKGGRDVIVVNVPWYMSD